MSKIKVTKEEVQALIENGTTRKDLAAHYGVSVLQVNKLIERLGLKGVKAKKFDFEIVEEVINVPLEEQGFIDVPLEEKWINDLPELSGDTSLEDIINS